MECPFCQPIEEDEIYISPHWRVIINLNQNRLGNVLIVLRRHAEDIVELSDAELMDLWAVLRLSKTAIETSFKPSHFNYGFQMNRTRHVHLHVTPRYTNNPSFEDIIFTDDDTITHRKMPPSVHARIRGRIRRAIEE